MEIFFDTADLGLITWGLQAGLCDGVTTNPTIMLKAGIKNQRDFKQRQVAIAKLIAPRPLSVEVTTDHPATAIQQAREYYRWAKNIMVKVTVIDRAGSWMLPVIHQLAAQGIPVNVTAILTQNQAMLAAKSLRSGQGSSRPRKNSLPHIISIFAGRISEEHGVETATRIIRNVRQWVDLHHYPVKILVGSIRTPENVDSWSMSQAHILTIPPEVITKSALSGRSMQTVSQFIQDAEAALQKIG